MKIRNTKLKKMLYFGSLGPDLQIYKKLFLLIHFVGIGPIFLIYILSYFEHTNDYRVGKLWVGALFGLPMLFRFYLDLFLIWLEKEDTNGSDKAETNEN